MLRTPVGAAGAGAAIGANDPDAPTRARVIRSILQEGPSTAAQLAERLDVTPAAVRRHLEALVDDGSLEARKERPTGSRGRPARVFALTDAGRQQFDQQYDTLAVQALRFLSQTQGEEAVAEFARTRVAFIERDFASVRAAHPDLSPAEVLARVLSAEGYAAAVHETAVGPQLCQQHCPVSHVASEFPQLCEAETHAISAVLGQHVQRLATIAHGDGVCTTCIPHATGDMKISNLPDPTEQNGASA